MNFDRFFLSFGFLGILTSNLFATSLEFDLDGKGTATVTITTADFVLSEYSDSEALAVGTPGSSESDLPDSVEFEIEFSPGDDWEMTEPTSSPHTVSVGVGSTESVSWEMKEKSSSGEEEPERPDAEKPSMDDSDNSGSIDLHAAMFELYFADTKDDENDDYFFVGQAGSSSSSNGGTLNVEIKSPVSLTIDLAETESNNLTLAQNSVSGTSAQTVEVTATSESPDIDGSKIEGTESGYSQLTDVEDVTAVKAELEIMLADFDAPEESDDIGVLTPQDAKDGDQSDYEVPCHARLLPGIPSASGGEMLTVSLLNSDNHVDTSNNGAPIELPHNGDTAQFVVRGITVSSSENDTILELQHDGSTIADQDMTIVKVSITHVAFSGAGYHEVKSDAGQAYDTASWHWIDADRDGEIVLTEEEGSDTLRPVALVASQKPSVQAKFHLEPAITPADFLIEATTVGNSSADFTDASVDTSKLEMGAMQLAELDGKVKLLNASSGSGGFEIEWSAKLSSNGNYIPILTTAHSVFQVASTPTVGDNNFETVFYYGCVGAQGSEVRGQELVDQIYQSFQTRDMFLVAQFMMAPSETPMKYWGNPNAIMGSLTTGGGAGYSVSGLVTNGDGACEAWGQFLIATAAVHGITLNERVIVLKSPADMGLTDEDVRDDIIAEFSELFQKRNNVVPESVRAGLEGPDLAVRNWTGQNKIGFGGWDKRASGLPAQSNPTPVAKNFNNHVVIQYGNDGNLYDPSYGSGPFNSLAEWEDEAFQGFLYRVTFSFVIDGETYVFDPIQWFWNSPDDDSEGPASVKFN